MVGVKANQKRLLVRINNENEDRGVEVSQSKFPLGAMLFERIWVDQFKF